MAGADSTNANRYKGKDIDTDGDGAVEEAEHAAEADHAQDATTVKGNDVDGDGDGRVDAADHAVEADHAQDATTVKGNDVDANGDGRVDAADHATTADSATSADSAATADVASNADQLGGNPPRHFDKTATPPEAQVLDNVGETPVTVNFTKTYDDPVVLALPRRPAGTKWAGSKHQYTQIQNVTATSAEIYQNEQLVADGSITATPINWAVFESGIYKVGNVLFEVGKVPDVGSAFSSASLSADFSDPVIMHDTQTQNTVYSTWSRIRNPSTSGFDVRIEGDTGSPETVGYVAAEQVEDHLGGIEVTSTPEHDVTDAYQPETFSRQYGDPPAVFAESCTTNGINLAYAMVRDATDSGFEVAIEEPASEDGNHGAAETVGFLYFPSGLVGAQNNADTVEGRSAAELGATSTTDDGSDVTEYGHGPTTGSTTVCDLTGSGVLLGGESYLDNDGSGTAQVEITVDGGTTWTVPYREVYHGGASTTHYVASIPSVRFDSSLKIVANAGGTSYYATTSTQVIQ